MHPSEELAELFKAFPGVGPRQARRFVYHLLTRPKGTVERVATLIKSLQKEVISCVSCRRFFFANGDTTCTICRNENRDQTLLAIVCRDVDVEALEKSNVFKGRYFVLGGTVPLMEESPEKHIRLDSLLSVIKRQAEAGLSEVIIAMNASPEGDHTATIVRRSLAPLQEKHTLKITTLGRGLSTGTELEYADSDTIGNALRNRAKT